MDSQWFIAVPSTTFRPLETLLTKNYKSGWGRSESDQNLQIEVL